MRKTLLLAVVLTLAAAPAFAVFDGFNYADGSLNPNGAAGGWSKGNAGTSWITVVSQTVLVKGGSAPGTRTAGNEVIAAGMTGKVTVDFQIMPTTNLGSNCWSLYLDDVANKDAPSGSLARFYGGDTLCRGRQDGGAVTPNTGALALNTWSNLRIIMDPVANTSEFICNGVSLGTVAQAAGAGDTIGRVSIAYIDNAGAAGELVYIDNLNITVPEPSGLIALAVGLVGALGAIRRRLS